MNNKEEREMNFSKENFKRIMEEKGYSQRYLAEKTNVSQSNLSYYSRGITNPSKKTVKVLAKELGVQPEDLLKNPESIEVAQKGEYEDILEISKELGNIRYKLIQMIQSLNLEETKYNMQDQDFLHKIENIEDLTEEEALDIIRVEQSKRKTRRICKTRKHLIQVLLNGFLIKSPYTYMQKVIEKSKDWTYIPRIAEELKTDNKLYDLNKEKEIKEEENECKKNG